MCVCEYVCVCVRGKVIERERVCVSHCAIMGMSYTHVCAGAGARAHTHTDTLKHIRTHTHTHHHHTY
jgi:hypothetical protein